MASLPESEVARIRSYLVTVANRLPLSELVDKVRRDCLPLEAASRLIPVGSFTLPPAPSEWSAAEVWAHILEMNETGAAAIEAILDEGRFVGRTVDDTLRRGRDLPTDGPTAYARYHARREQLLARVARARGDEHLDVTIHHPMFGDLTWREWLLFMRVHDLDHLRQLQAIAASHGLTGEQG